MSLSTRPHSGMAAYTRNERWRPRRGRLTDYRSTTTPSADLSFVLKDLEERVATFPPNATGYSSELVHLCHVKPVASYSWIDTPVPTIAVPGSPWFWIDDSSVRQVPLDSGVQYIHQNASRMGNHSSTLPFFAAIDVLHDDFPYNDLDLITDRNGLRKLLRYIENADKDDNFRINVDLFGKTCLFTRQEESATIVGQNTGYGNEYLKAATGPPPGCEEMFDHHRIISYKFGSLKILLSFSADARIQPKNEGSEDDFLTAFSSLTIGDKAVKTTMPPQSSPANLDIKLTSPRTLVPQSELVEVKTLSLQREPNWKEIYPQLYLSQTPWLYLARHRGGLFLPAEKISLAGEEMKPCAEMMERSFAKLENLLKEILKAVHAQGEGVSLSLVRQGATLSLWKRKKGCGEPLGEEITSRFKPKAVS